MKLNTDILKKIARAILHTREEEIGCGKCWQEIDEFIERKLAGKSAEEAYPLVQEHLEKCVDCREEYKALLKALKATT